MLFIFTKPYTFFSFHFLLPYWRTFITISLFLLAFIFCLHPWAFKLKDVFCNHGYNWSNIPKGQWWVFEITLSTRRVLEAFIVLNLEDREDVPFSCRSSNSGYIYIQINFYRVRSDCVCITQLGCGVCLHTHAAYVMHIYCPQRSQGWHFNRPTTSSVKEHCCCSC